MMLIFCIILGLQQVVLKISAADISPMLSVAFRSLGALMIIMMIHYAKKAPFYWSTTWRAGCVSGIFFALEYLFIAIAFNYTYVSHTIIFLYTAPIFTALMLNFRLAEERLNIKQWLGMGIAIMGIVMAFYQPNETVLPYQLLGDLLSLLAGVSWAINTVIIRTTVLASIPASQTLFYQHLLTVTLLLISAPFLNQHHVNWTMITINSLFFQIMIVAVGSFMLWFWLLQRYIVSQLAIFSLLTPVFGMFFSVLLLSEPLTKNFSIGAITIITGVIAIVKYQSKKSA